MKDASLETQRTLDATLKASVTLETLDINEHAGALAVLEAIAQQRAEKRIEKFESVEQILRAAGIVAEQMFNGTLEDHAEVHGMLKITLMRRMSDANQRHQAQRTLSIDRAEAAMAGAIPRK